KKSALTGKSLPIRRLIGERTFAHRSSNSDKSASGHRVTVTTPRAGGPTIRRTNRPAAASARSRAASANQSPRGPARSAGGVDEDAGGGEQFPVLGRAVGGAGEIDVGETGLDGQGQGLGE